MLHSLALVPGFALLGFLIVLVVGRKLGDPKAGWVGTGAILGSFVCTLLTFFGLLSRPASNRFYIENLFSWIPVGSLHVNIAFLADPLSMTMALFVTGVSTLIHLYAIGYMRRDRDFPKFFVYFNLFVFSMLVLVLADNFVLTFLGWEGVGACSYFLIAYFFEKDSAATAGKFAFIVNRIGDFGFLMAIFLIFAHTGSVTYQGAFRGALGQSCASGSGGHLLHCGLSSGTLEAICLLLFLGAIGKSAQLPLSLWLADAMEGPTPVSALIHAATMVTAGVFLMARVGPLLSHAPIAQDVIASVGVLTAFVAATIGTSQNDIKKVLAYSTVSQLGYMFLGIGSGAYVAAIFLMVTHAFYKALLFLGSGSVIHAMGDEQDIKKMGALRKYMPITSFTFIIGWLAIAGVPPFSGFWSKGDVLDGAFAKSPILWAVGALTAILTAYYMGREVYLVFFGQSRWQSRANNLSQVEPGKNHDSHSEPHEPTWLMWLPLVILAFFATIAGLLNLPFTAGIGYLDRWLTPVFGTSHLAISTSGKWLLAAGDGVLAISGVVIAASLWRNVWNRPKLEPKFLQDAWGLYSVYEYLVSKPAQAIAKISNNVVETKVIDGAVNSSAGLVGWTGLKLRKLQSGYVRNYALGISIGVVLVLVYMIVRA